MHDDGTGGWINLMYFNPKCPGLFTVPASLLASTTTCLPIMSEQGQSSVIRCPY